MCVLGRPFGLRQMARLGKNTALVRDMTDTSAIPRPPHHSGLDAHLLFHSHSLNTRPRARYKRCSPERQEGYAG